jgi:hypothetical protein
MMRPNSLREDAGKLIPGALSLRKNDVGDNVECKQHGVKFTPGSVRVGFDTVAVCLDCYTYGSRNIVKEPLEADPICRHDGCNDRAGFNWCKLCESRYCTSHMYLAGHGGTCVDCMAGDSSGMGTARKVESLEDMPCNRSGACQYSGLFFCQHCRKYFCKMHISSDYDGMCTVCSGEEDEDVLEAN